MVTTGHATGLEKTLLEKDQLQTTAKQHGFGTWEGREKGRGVFVTRGKKLEYLLNWFSNSCKA